MTRRRLVVLGVVLIAGVGAAWAWRRAAAPRVTGPHVILISIDSLRADHLGCHGYARATSPSIDALAAQSVHFAECLAESSWTIPSHATMLTGVSQQVHGVTALDRQLVAAVPSLATRLRSAGYRTHAVVSAAMLDEVFGFAQGFETYHNLEPWPRHEGDLVPAARWPKEVVTRFVGAPLADRTTDRAIEQLRGVGSDERVFMFVHYWDVHYRYDPPGKDREAFGTGSAGPGESLDFFAAGGVAKLTPAQRERLVSLYDGEILHTDRAIGRLLKWLDASGIGKDTLIILTSDHGESFFERGRVGHGQTLYPEVLRVPLMIRPPGGARPRAVRAPASLRDIAPTVLAAAGLGTGGLPGRDLLGADSSPGPILASLREDRLALRSGRYALHRIPSAGGRMRWELYDASTDPQQKSDIARTQPAVVARLRREMVAELNARGAYREQHFPGINPQSEALAPIVPALGKMGYFK